MEHYIEHKTHQLSSVDQSNSFRHNIYKFNASNYKLVQESYTNQSEYFKMSHQDILNANQISPAAFQLYQLSWINSDSKLCTVTVNVPTKNNFFDSTEIFINSIYNEKKEDWKTNLPIINNIFPAKQSGKKVNDVPAFEFDSCISSTGFTNFFLEFLQQNKNNNQVEIGSRVLVECIQEVEEPSEQQIVSNSELYQMSSKDLRVETLSDQKTAANLSDDDKRLSKKDDKVSTEAEYKPKFSFFSCFCFK